jgi:hypothetical protein
MSKIKIIFGIFLGLLSAINIYVYRNLLLKAEPIGDTKSGLGDPVNALKIEGIAQRNMILASILLGLSAGILFKLSVFYRIILSISVTIATIIILFFWGFLI